MSKQQNPGYHGVRAGEERRKADSAQDPEASAAHADLAARYQALSFDPALTIPTISNSAGGGDTETDADNLC